MPLIPNSRHEQFAQGLAIGKSATEAYKDAGYKGDRTAACRLTTNVNVQARVQELQTVSAQRTEVTIASLIQEAEEVRSLAVAERQLSAANTAIVTKAKLSGLWVDRSEVGEVDVNRMSTEEIEDYLRQRYGEERGNQLIAWLEKGAQTQSRDHASSKPDDLFSAKGEKSAASVDPTEIAISPNWVRCIPPGPCPEITSS